MLPFRCSLWRLFYVSSSRRTTTLVSFVYETALSIKLTTIGIFISFSDALDECLRSSIPVLFLALTLFGMSYPHASGTSIPDLLGWRSNNSLDALAKFTQNDLLLGTHDPFLWFLVPLFGIVSIGICVALNYITLMLTHVSAVVYTATLRLFGCSHSSFIVGSLKRRLVVTGALIMLVWTVIPYQFLFIVLCIAQLATCVRSLSLTRENVSHSLIPQMF